MISVALTAPLKHHIFHPHPSSEPTSPPRAKEPVTDPTTPTAMIWLLAQTALRLREGEWRKGGSNCGLDVGGLAGSQDTHGTPVQYLAGDRIIHIDLSQILLGRKMRFGGDSMWTELRNRSGLTLKEVLLEERIRPKARSTKFHLLFWRHRIGYWRRSKWAPTLRTLAGLLEGDEGLCPLFVEILGLCQVCMPSRSLEAARLQLAENRYSGLRSLSRCLNEVNSLSRPHYLMRQCDGVKSAGYTTGCACEGAKITRFDEAWRNDWHLPSLSSIALPFSWPLSGFDIPSVGFFLLCSGLGFPTITGCLGLSLLIPGICAACTPAAEPRLHRRILHSPQPNQTVR